MYNISSPLTKFALKLDRTREKIFQKLRLTFPEEHVNLSFQTIYDFLKKQIVWKRKKKKTRKKENRLNHNTINVEKSSIGT